MSDKVCLILGANPVDEILKQLNPLREYRVFIYEGDKYVCASLHERLKDSFSDTSEWISVVERFVTPDGNSARYYQLNMSSFNALARPKLLFEIYPNLKVTNTHEFDTLSIVDVAIKHQCEGAHNMLVINGVAQANSLISHLIDADLLSEFSQINTVACAEEWYESSQTENELQALLTSAGFELENEPPLDGDSDFPRFKFSLKNEHPAELDSALEFSKLKKLYQKAIQQNGIHEAALKKKESEKERLALQNLNLISENSFLKKQNELIRKELDEIEIQMDLLRQLNK